MFRLTIDTSNASFRDEDDLARYLDLLASMLRAGLTPPSEIIDWNGNTVGTLEID